MHWGEKNCTQAEDTHSHTCTCTPLMYTHFHCKQSVSCEFYFQAGSKKLCLAHAALEQITLFDLWDFELWVQRWPGKEKVWNHVDQQNHLSMMSLINVLYIDKKVLKSFLSWFLFGRWQFRVLWIKYLFFSKALKMLILMKSINCNVCSFSFCFRENLVISKFLVMQNMLQESSWKKRTNSKGSPMV